MLDHDVGRIEVETESFGDVESGLREDMSIIWGNFRWMRGEVGDLDKVWQSSEKDAFVSSFDEIAGSFERTLDALQKFVEAFGKAEEYYNKLKDELAEQKAKLA